MTAVTSITPGRGLGGEVIQIAGSGFSTAYNRVEFDGAALPASSVSTISSTLIAALAPTGLTPTKFSVVRVTNLETGEAATWYWWVKDISGNVRSDSYLPGKVPGNEEQAPDVTDSYVIRSVNFEEFASYVGAVDDALAAKGSMLIGDGSKGLEILPVGSDGNRFTAGQGASSSATAPKAWYSLRRVVTLSWGLKLVAGDVTEKRMIFNGTSDSTAGGSKSYAMHGNGVVSNISLYVDSVTGGTDKINSLVIYMNDFPSWDSLSNTLVGDFALIAGAQDVWSAGVGLQLSSAAANFEIGITKSGSTSEIEALVSMQVVLL